MTNEKPREYPFVKAAVSNTKGGVRAELGRKTLIVGNNGDGKSAIVNAIELALDGRASDIRGRNIVATDKELQETLGPIDKDLYSNVTLSNGSYVQETLATFAARRKAPLATFITRDVEAAIAGSSATLRRFLLNFAVEEVKRETVLALLPSDLREKYADAVSFADDDETLRELEGFEDGKRPPHETPDEIDLLLTSIEKSKGLARSKAKEAKQHEATAATVHTGAALPPSAGDVAAATKTVEEATALLEKATGAAGAADANRVTAAALNTQIEVEELRLTNAAKAKADAVAKFKAAEKAYAEMGELPPALSDAQKWQLDGLRMHVKNAALKCGCCGGATADGVFKVRLEKLEALIGKREEIEKATAAYAEALNDNTLAESEFEAAQTALENLKKIVPLPVAAAADATNATQARRMLDEARARHGALVKASERWKAAEIARDRARAAAKDAEVFKALALACESVVSRLVASAEEDFTRRVQKWLPQADRFYIKFGGENGETRFGLLGEGVVSASDPKAAKAMNAEQPGLAPHIALSGGEWARVVAAIACACEEKAREKALQRRDDSQVPFPILTLPDRAIHPDVLAEIMDAWEPLPFQVILTSVVRPSYLPKGWTIVTLKDDRRVRVKKPEPVAVASPEEVAERNRIIRSVLPVSASILTGAVDAAKPKLLREAGFDASPVAPVAPAPVDDTPQGWGCDAGAGDCTQPASPDETVKANFCKLHGAENIPIDIRREWAIDAQARASKAGRVADEAVKGVKKRRGRPPMASVTATITEPPTPAAPPTVEEPLIEDF